MPIYTFGVNCRLHFDIQADNEEEAKERAAAMRQRIIDAEALMSMNDPRVSTENDTELELEDTYDPDEES